MESQLVVDQSELDADGFLLRFAISTHAIDNLWSEIRSLGLRAESRDTEALKLNESTEGQRKYMLQLESRELRAQARKLKAERIELLTEKFNLFSGVFGASDEVLGTIESGVDFEKRILSIYQECRTPEEIDAAFKALQTEMDETIRTRLNDTRKQLFEHFDEEVHQRLKLQLEDTKAQLDRFSKRFWWSRTRTNSS